MGSGAKPQKLATNCTCKHQFHIANCYFSTEMSIIHFVSNLLQPACDMLATGRSTAGTGNSLFLHRIQEAYVSSKAAYVGEVGT